jgi:hypothetical protein
MNGRFGKAKMLNRRKQIQILGVQNRLTKMVLGCAAMVLLAHCSKNELQPAPEAQNKIPADARVQVKTTRLTVVDTEGRPIANAKVMIGLRPGLPFAANVIETDAAGHVGQPASWIDAQPITIEAPGYVRATYFSQMPRDAIFKIRHAHAPKPLQLQGVTTGFGTLVRNGTLDVSLVFPAVPVSQASSLELTQLIGTGVDKISVYGETINLPANLSIPLQSESVYVVVPVTLDKPTYRTFVPFAGTYRFAAVHARFDFKRTIEDFQAGKSFFDVINRIDFQSYTTRDFDMRLPAQSASLPLGENGLAASVPVRAAGLPGGYAMLATTLAYRNGLCTVTDVKRLLEGESRTLKASNGAVETLLVRTLKKYDSTRVDFSGADYEEASVIMTPASHPMSSSFLPLLAPIRTQGRTLVAIPPTLPAGVDAGLTQVTLSKVDVANDGDLKLVEKSPLWDLYAAGFAASMELPATSNEVWALPGRYRWELRYGGTEGSHAVPIVDANRLSPDAIGEMSHVVKTAVDFSVP